MTAAPSIIGNEIIAWNATVPALDLIAQSVTCTSVVLGSCGLPLATLNAHPIASKLSTVTVKYDHPATYPTNLMQSVNRQTFHDASFIEVRDTTWLIQAGHADPTPHLVHAVQVAHEMTFIRKDDMTPVSDMVLSIAIKRGVMFSSDLAVMQLYYAKKAVGK